ncbi:MAG: phosphatidate cytidylyltransferase [Andreesenia angusta]|nr:phosphatidate cytidylyltransferase [Andreesenia angusta]
MKTRIISGLIGLALLFLVVYLGNPVFDIVILILSLIALFEYNNAISSIKDSRLPITINYLFAVSLFFIKYFNMQEYMNFVIFLYLIFIFCEFVFLSQVKTRDLALSLLGGFYLVYMMSYLYDFADSVNIWYVFLIASGSDTFAYFIGKSLGRHKLAPSLSPKKTIEGFIAGIIGGVLLGLIFAYKFNPEYLLEIGIMAVLVSLVSVLGDIFASKIKRESGIKDYGNIMPGHGGILDRLDSIIFTAPIVYYFMYYFIR